MVALVCSLEFPPRVICSSDSWLTNEDNPFLLAIPRNNETFSKCRMGRSGVVMIQVRQNLIAMITPPCELSEFFKVELK